MSKRTLWLTLFLLSAGAIFLSPLIGEKTLALTEIFGGEDEAIIILYNFRLPRMVFAFLTGAGLAMIGAVFQGMLRNDLATPYTLGISSGSAFGAVIAIKLGLDASFLGFSMISVFGVAAGAITMFLIGRIAATKYGLATSNLILAGVTLSIFFSALTLLIHYLADFTETYRMIRWMMGTLETAGWRYPLVLLLTTLPVAIYLLLNYQSFNVLLTGKEMALSKGVDVYKVESITFYLTSVLVGVIVSLAGPIGFVGLIVPHVLRLMGVMNYRELLPASFISGGVFLVWCDTLARVLIAPAELPVGIITALIGGPFFIFLLLRGRKDY